MRRDDEFAPPSTDITALLRAGTALNGFWRESGIDAAELSALEKILAGGPQGFRRHLDRPLHAWPNSGSPPQKTSGRPSTPPRPVSPARPAPPSVRTPPGTANAVSGPMSQALAEAEERARSVSDLDALNAQMRQFDHCSLKRTAAHTMIFAGPVSPKLMLIGGAPGREDDDQGTPWSGKAGALLEAMLGAIGIDRKSEVLCGYSVFWRPPGDRDPVPSESALCAPFLRRAIALAKPPLIVLAGSFAAQFMLQRSETIARLRGKSFAYRPAASVKSGPGPEAGNIENPAFEIPAFVVLEPKHLLLRPQDKARAWEDLLILRQELDRAGQERAGH